MRRRLTRRGIILISALLVVLLATMFLGAGFTLSQMDASMAGSAEDQQAASEAAQAGLAYVRTRLQEDPKWPHAGSTVKVNLPGKLWIKEENGNVVGIITEPTGRLSRFRVRFNYQNGSAAPDDSLPDPSSAMRFDLPYVSENNLDSNLLKHVYRAIPSGGTYKVLDGSSPTPFDASRYTAVILSEGVSGDGLRDLSPTNLNPTGSGRHVARRVVEATLTRDLTKLGNAAVNGGNELIFSLKNNGRMKVESRDGGVPPRARTMENMTATMPGTAGVEMGSTGEVIVNESGGTFKVNGVDSTAPAATQQDSSADIPSITWSEIPKADSGDLHLNAGTYVWREHPRRLEYYAQEYDDSVGPPPLGTPPDATYTSGNDLDGGAGVIQMDKPEMMLTVKGDVFVEPVGAVQGIAIVAQPGLIDALQNRPDIKLAPASPTSPPPIITSTGPVMFQGELSGNGSVTSEGNVTFQGSSVLEADANGKVAIYSKGDITLDPIPSAIAGGGTYIPPTGGSGAGSGGSPAPISAFLQGLTPPFGAPQYHDIGFAGLFYAMGDIHTNLGGATPADLYFRGVVVAFGGDPEAGTLPGRLGSSLSSAVSGKGKIDMHGGNVHMVYDSTYIRGAVNQVGATKLNLTSFQTY